MQQLRNITSDVIVVGYFDWIELFFPSGCPLISMDQLPEIAVLSINNRHAGKAVLSSNVVVYRHSIG